MTDGGSVEKRKREPVDRIARSILIRIERNTGTLCLMTVTSEVQLKFGNSRLTTNPKKETKKE